MDGIILIVVAVVAAAVVGVVAVLFWQNSYPNIAKRVVRTPRDVAVTTNLATRDGQVVYTKLTARVQGVEAQVAELIEALTRAPSVGDTRVEAIVSAAVQEGSAVWARGQDASLVGPSTSLTPPALTTAVAERLRASGLTLHDLDVDLAVELTPQMQGLQRYFVGDCFLDEPFGISRTINVLDLYLDATSERPRWYIETCPRDGGTVRHTTSAEFLADPSLCAETCYVDETSGWVRRFSFEDMLAGRE